MHEIRVRQYKIVSVAIRFNSSVERQPVWEPLTGERQDLDLGDLESDVVSVDWPANGDRLLPFQIHQASQQLYVYHFSTGTQVKLAHTRRSG